MARAQHGYMPLDVDEIRAATRGLLIGAALHYYPRLDSTNRQARDLLAGDWINGTVVIADFQVAGRGRQGRRWLAPPDSSLLLSILLETPPGAAAMDMAMAGSLAVADSVAQVTGVPVELKWPNDALLRGRKFCGILAEATAGGPRRCVVLGIGLNVNFDPVAHGAPETATSLQNEVGRPLCREMVAVALFKALDLWYRGVTRDPDAVYRAWSSRMGTVGSPVLVVESGATWAGTAIGIRRDGGLLVCDDAGVCRAVYAADVSIRNPGVFTSP